MVFLKIYHKFWGITFLYAFFQLKYQSSSIIEPNAYERYLLNFLVTYSINFFRFHIYNIDFHGLSNDISQVLGNNFSIYVFAT